MKRQLDAICSCYTVLIHLHTYIVQVKSFSFYNYVKLSKQNPCNIIDGCIVRQIERQTDRKIYGLKNV